MGASNASFLVDAGLLDSAMTLLASGALVAGGSHLLAGERSAPIPSDGFRSHSERLLIAF